MEVVENLGIDDLKIIQDDKLYRFTSDSVILSKFASNKKDEIVADFCSGSGIVGIHYYALNKNLKSVDLYEIQKELFDLSVKSIELNNLKGVFSAYNKPIQDIDKSYNDYYSLILCNPPYKKKDSGFVNPDNKIAICRHEITITQSEIVNVAYKKLRVGGRLCMCQRIERFIELISDLKNAKLEPCKIQFVSTAYDKPPYLFLIEAVKGVKPQLKVLETIINGG